MLKQWRFLMADTLCPPFSTTSNSAATRKHNLPWSGKNILRGEGKRTFGGQTFTKYTGNKINNNSENFRGARLLPGGLSP